jgi:uncharacterized membrane protein YeiH
MIYIEIAEYIGVAAFAICGAMAAIDKGADIFGVLFLAVITALGGGVIRDIILGYLPPRMFTSYAYICVALVSALVIFLDAYIRTEKYRENETRLDSFVNVLDAIGLAVFTITGMDMAIAQCGMDKPVLLVMLGMTTGVGGGMLRDVLIDVMPAVLRKRIYAVASMVGGIVYYVLLWLGVHALLAGTVSIALIFALRILATVKKWSLPKVKL